MNTVPQIENSWKVVGNKFSALGESPVWDELTHSILWVDISGGRIHQYETRYGQPRSLNIGEKIGAIAPCRSSSIYIAALKRGFSKINFLTGEIIRIANPEAAQPDNRFNDGKCDPDGRFWAGTMSEISGVRNAGKLYTLHPDHTVITRIDQVSCSNGLAWNIEKQLFYYIDTPTRSVVAYDYERATGNISNKRTIIIFPLEMGLPDGMTIDTEGMLYIAHWGAGKISKWNPFTSTCLLEFILPVTNVSSCTFGGEQLEDLYVTSAKNGLSAAQLLDQPLAGALFVIKKCGSKGLNAHRFLDKA